MQENPALNFECLATGDTGDGLFQGGVLVEKSGLRNWRMSLAGNGGSCFKSPPFFNFNSHLAKVVAIFTFTAGESLRDHEVDYCSQFLSHNGLVLDEISRQ